MKSTQNHQFSQTKKAEIPRSSFDLSHGLKTTINAGELVPFFNMEVLPGDTINLRASMLGRIATLIKPIMDNVFLEQFYFFIPWRQVWDNWQKFNGEQANPGDSTDYTIPILSGPTKIGTGQPGDYYGLPLGLDPAIVPVSALPFRAMQHVYNNWFRDQNLINSRNMSTGDGPDDYGVNYGLNFKRRKRFDYLTSCLPWPQKGPDVTVDLGGNAPIHAGNSAGTDTIGVISDALGTADKFLVSGTDVIMNTPTAIVPGATLYANLSAATGFTINDLRESFQIQKLLERDARGGTRYPEILRSHFGVTDPQMLVHQRPQFLGGGSTMLNVNPIASTAPTDSTPETAPQANLSAYGTLSSQGSGFTQSFTEHGCILGFVNVRADLTYQQGLERYWSRTTRFDFYWPALSHLGEQAVLQKEIFVTDVQADNDKVFGYQERYGEYRYIPSHITGLFRSAAASSLDVWHLAQDFSAAPTLNQAFIEENPPMDRIEAVPTEPDILLDVYFKIRAARPLPLYGTPGLIDHF